MMNVRTQLILGLVLYDGHFFCVSLFGILSKIGTTLRTHVMHACSHSTSDISHSDVGTDKHHINLVAPQKTRLYWICFWDMTGHELHVTVQKLDEAPAKMKKSFPHSVICYCFLISLY